MAIRFDEALLQMGKDIAELYKAVPEADRLQAQEIRLRSGNPPAITDANGSSISYGSRNVSVYEIESAFVSLCGHSVYSHTEELKNGYLTVKGGHRAGFGCRAVYDHDGLLSIREISSINLRIAREIVGCSNQIAEKVFADGLCGVLFAGAPSSGKTTILRDIARYISEAGSKVTICDERGEIAAVSDGVSKFRLGHCCDILSGFSKAQAVMRAIRCLSPRVVICDEIGNDNEAEALSDALNAGVEVIASVHAANEKEFISRPQCIKMIMTGAFEKIVFLPRSYKDKDQIKIMKAGDLIENYRRRADSDMRMPYRCGA